MGLSWVDLPQEVGPLFLKFGYVANRKAPS